jgi:hypothetical protein
MKNFSCFIFISVILIFISGSCMGQNGNPLELVGKWEESHSNQGGSNSINFTNEITFKDDGTFIEDTTVSNPAINGSLEFVVKGKYYGDPTSVPKLINVEITDLSGTDKGINLPNGDGNGNNINLHSGSFSGNYFLQYSTPNKLGISINFSDISLYSSNNDFTTTFGGQYFDYNMSYIFIKK